jgi:hypothetical protein
MKLVRSTPIVLALIAMAGLPEISKANLVMNGGTTSTDTSLNVTLLWNGGRGQPDTFNFSDANWSLMVLASDSGHLVRADLQHLTGGPGPALEDLFSPFTRGSSAGPVSDVKPHLTGTDKLTVSIQEVGGSGNSRILISGVHTAVPEPTTAAAWIFAGGSLLFAARRRLRR